MPEIKFKLANYDSFLNGKAHMSMKSRNSVRILLPDGQETALCTTTYSYSMSYELKDKIARRIVDLWNGDEGVQSVTLHCHCRNGHHWQRELADFFITINCPICAEPPTGTKLASK